MYCHHRNETLKAKYSSCGGYIPMHYVYLFTCSVPSILFSLFTIRWLSGDVGEGVNEYSSVANGGKWEW